MTIKISQENIDKGARTYGSRCAISLSINALLRNDFYSVVGHTDLAIYERSKKEKIPDDLVFRLKNHKLGKWINAYDRREKAAPFAFDLPIPINIIK